MLTAVSLGVMLLIWPMVARAQTAAPPQGAARLKVDLLGVFAHPDDETGVATTVAHYALGRNKAVAHAYITRGEGGGNMVGTQAGPALGLLREVELRDCLAELGVRHCCFLDQLDWAYTESLAATLRKWGHDETLERVVRVIRTFRPEVIVTMNPAPNPGQHGHHQAAGVLAIEAFSAAADPRRFPTQLRREGLPVWQARKIYISGGGSNASTFVAVSDPLPDGRTPGQVAAAALAHHRSQAFGNFSNAPWLSRPQAFILAKSMVGYPQRETDLFAGLSPSDAPTDRAEDQNKPPGAEQRPPADSPGLAFVPRPAIANYQRWVRREGIDHLVGRFRADVPLVAGEANPVILQITRAPEKVATPSRGRLRLVLPAGWSADDPMRALRQATVQDRSLQVTVRVTPPAGRPPDGELAAMFEADEGLPAATASAVGHPVPRAVVKRLRRAPALDGTEPSWAGLTSVRVGPADLAQGRVDGEKDSSASFRLAHDGEHLFIDVRVVDDQVVSNIAPDDIKGHWRSDSVEICIDPAGGAEDTMGCFKIGIFPFDATGVVRAARDADARQGPIEETSPGTKLFSMRTPDGYRVQAAIPFRDLGGTARRGRRLGFNVIVYDGDKPNAAPGENINESRIAWSPRPGVQGRPEDWGRIDLE